METAKCAYSTMGMVAIPLDQCSVYSMKETLSMSYSSKYTFNKDTNTLNWHYYHDLECNKEYKKYEMDDVMMSIHHINLQTDGKGSNCDTVNIKINGNYDYLIEECDNDKTTNDYQTRSFVINECISSPIEGTSAILICNQHELYFNYFKACTDCQCYDDVEQIIYQYYEDKCYEFECNNNNNDYNQNWIYHSQSQSITNKKPDSQFIKNLITQTANTPFFTNKMQTIQTKQDIKENVSASMERWLCIVIGTVVFVICCGICRYINNFQKEYATI